MSVISAAFSEMFILCCILCLRFCPSIDEESSAPFVSRFVFSNHVKQKIKLFWRVGRVCLLALETV